jgi:hypothetical protein
MFAHSKLIVYTKPKCQMNISVLGALLLLWLRYCETAYGGRSIVDILLFVSFEHVSFLISGRHISDFRLSIDLLTTKSF